MRKRVIREKPGRVTDTLMTEGKGWKLDGGTPLDREHTNINSTIWRKKNNLNHVDYACYSAQWVYAQNEHKKVIFYYSLVGLTSHVPLMIWASCCAVRF